jgi:hypothetical protein
MGYLHPKIHEIPEGPIDFIFDYFADAPRDGDGAAMINRFVTQFRREYPAWAASKGIDGFAQLALDHLQYPDGRWCHPPDKPIWREIVAFQAIVTFSDRTAAIGDALAQDLATESYGNLWDLLEKACTTKSERAAGDDLQDLMLDCQEMLLLPELQRASKRVALLRPEAVVRLRSAGPLIERFLQAVGTSDRPVWAREAFAQDLRELAEFLSATETPDACLFCESETS